MSGVPQFRKRLNKIISNYDKYVDTILEEICQEIVNEAKTKLLESRYDVLGLLNNITYTMILLFGIHLRNINSRKCSIEGRYNYERICRYHDQKSITVFF